MSVHNPPKKTPYDIIKSLIITAKLKPNTQVSRSELSRELNIGISPTREAMLALSNEGLFRIVPQSGTYVSKINLQELDQAYFVIRTLEEIIFKEAYGLIGSESISELEKMKSIHKLLADDSNNEMLIQFLLEFHQFFFELTKKSYVWEWINVIGLSITRYRYLKLDTQLIDWHTIQEKQNNLVELLKNGSKLEYELEIVNYLNSTKPIPQPLMEKYPDFFE